MQRGRGVLESELQKVFFSHSQASGSWYSLIWMRPLLEFTRGALSIPTILCVSSAR